MKILLINNNPLVSRMLALCTRDEEFELVEVKSMDEIGEETYDLLFVDDASYADPVDVLLDDGSIKQKVFISYSSEAVKGFDETIKKPFLPSQIINVIESVELTEVGDESLEKHSIFPLSTEEAEIEEVEEIEEEAEDLAIFSLPVEDESEDEILELPEETEIEEGKSEEKAEEPVIFPLSIEDETQEEEIELLEEVDTEVLDSNEIEKIKALLEMDDEAEEDHDLELLSEDDYEVRKVEVIKEQLIAEGLEIVEEEEILDVLSNKSKEKSSDKAKKSKTKRKEKGKEKMKEKNKKVKKEKNKASKFTKKEVSSIEEAFTRALENLKPKQMKKLLKGKEIEVKIKLEDTL
jgi:uncharacterized membrane protein